ncbi:MAG: carbamoyltransferase [Hoeflea sp.]|uniref:carbamoyltransferase family protein n=1 Tax=Hoeflea sp. TaxID=1940281 RepID=UPI0032EAFF29
MSVIVGLSAYFHDSAAAIVVDGKIVAAAQEERFTRIKHDPGFPTAALDYVMKEAGVGFDEISHIAFHDKPFLKFERLLETYLSFAPRGFSSFRTAMPIWLREKLFMKGMIADSLTAMGAGKAISDKLMFCEHHVAHAASAFYPSPFEEALVLTMDGVGEWATTSVAIGRGHELDVVKELHFPHSLGLFYSAFTYYLGFKVNSGEYKVMGLAPYGEPRFADKIMKTMIDIKPDGSFRLDQRYFNYTTGLTMTSEAFHRLFGEPPRKPDELLTAFHMDVAASLQYVTEFIVLAMTRALSVEYGIRNLCLAGGVALNCVANGKVLRDGSFDSIWVQPASGDAGGSLGAALATWHGELAQPRKPKPADSMSGSYLGPVFSDAEIAAALDRCGAVYRQLPDNELIGAVADQLAQEQAVGWFQGRMEFGPRALGARSILGDPRSADTQKTLNLKVKFRESFRPFAPAIKRKKVGEWFEFDGDSPYMLMVADVATHRHKAMTEAETALFGIDKLNVARSDIPAVTHVDYSARIQTVHEETNPRFHALLDAFEDRTGCPLLVNTSFNVRGEPIVHTPEDAFHCFMGTGLDVLAIGNFLLLKEEQVVSGDDTYRDRYDAD